MSLSQYIAEQLGMAPDVVASLLLGLGALVLALGASLLALNALSLLRSDARGEPENWRLVSKLLPLLAQDTLATDLRAVYQKSLYLDALIEEIAPDLCTSTGTELGRHTRRALLALQARRYRDDEVEARRLPALRERLDRAIDAAERARPAPHVDVSALAELLRSPDAADTNSVQADAS